MIVILFSESIVEAWFVRQHSDEFQTEQLDSLMQRWQWQDDSVQHEKEKKLFNFNPNLASKEQLLELGFYEALANRIINFRNKKGVFRVKNDLLKIYGMDSALYRSLRGFILLPDSLSRITYQKELEKPKTVEAQDINEADSVTLLKIYGIGPKLAQRIVRYRHRLGGFITTNQLTEVYGLDSAVVVAVKKRFVVRSDFHPLALNINTATEKDLAQHPYIGFKLAKAITTYRFQHGNFGRLEDLLSIQVISEEAFSKMKPYLTY